MKYYIFLLLFIISFESFGQDLPPINLKYATQIFSEDNELIAYLGETKRVQVFALKELSKDLIDCLIATEDRDFYSHNGVSIKSLGRAALATITGKKQGGSTLTMQLCKNLFLTPEKTLERKFNEIKLAIDVEKKFSKDEILLLYVNTVYWGRNVYGIWAASKEYFNKSPNELTLSESALLIGLLKGPTYYDPVKKAQKALERRNEVLHNLLEVNKLTQKRYDILKKEPLKLNLRQPFGLHFVELVRKKTIDLLKLQNKTIESGPYKIYTTLNAKIQRAAEKSINSKINELSKTNKDLQTALVSLETETGKVKAMIGGNEKSQSAGLNRAFQIKRQAGSSFKPIMYAQMLQEGFTLGSPLPDSIITYNKGKQNEWTPKNYYDKAENKEFSMKYSITKSLNLPAAYSIMNLTSPEKVMNFAKQIGFQSPILPLPSIALGAVETNPLEMAKVFSVFASQGINVQIYYIESIRELNNNIIYRNVPKVDEVLDAETCYLITDALKAVVDSGTGSSIRKYYKGFAAGKTGTTNDNTDAWFIGYNADLVTAIWFGNDIPSQKFGNMKINGGTVAAPVFGNYYSEIDKIQPKIFKKTYLQPLSIKIEEICNDNGLPKYLSTDCKKSSFYPINTKIVNYKSAFVK